MLYYLVSQTGIKARSTRAWVIACENLDSASSELELLVQNTIPENRGVALDELVSFQTPQLTELSPNHLIEEAMDVKVERYHEWVVEMQPHHDSSRLPIDLIKWVDHTKPYITRKL